MIRKNSRSKQSASKRTFGRNSGNQNLCEKIQRKAYELFEKRGYTHGNDLADWLEAEKLVKSDRR